jgi:serine/threonine protein phosphatase 1
MKRVEEEDFSEGRLFAIGDIHGCSTALRTLIEAIAPRSEDTTVTLGDYIDWGPDSRGVIDLLIELSSRCHLVPLLGNHEEMLLAALDSFSELRHWLDFGGEDTLNSYQYDGSQEMIPRDHVQFIKGCRDYYETATHILAHGNYEPDLPIHQVGGAKLRWEQIDARVQRPHYSGKKVVVGHTPQVGGEILDLGFLVCIDTDCSRGGWLTAFDVRKGDVIRANQAGRVERRCR